jgi:hypothetical protein
LASQLSQLADSPAAVSSSGTFSPISLMASVDRALPAEFEGGPEALTQVRPQVLAAVGTLVLVFFARLAILCDSALRHLT